MALKCGNTGCKEYDKSGHGTHGCRHWFANLPHKCGFVEATAPPPVSPSNSSDLLVSTLREAKDFDKSAFVVALADVRDLAEYAKHDKWRCAYYKKCHCGLDDLTDKIGLERIPCE